MKEKIVLIGSGQHARVVIYNIKAQGKYEIACMLDSDKNKIGREYEDYLIEGTYEEAQRVKEKYKTNKFFIAFGNMKYRKAVFDQFIGNGWEAVNIIHPDAGNFSGGKDWPGCIGRVRMPYHAQSCNRK